VPRQHAEPSTGAVAFHRDSFIAQHSLAGQAVGPGGPPAGSKGARNPPRPAVGGLSTPVGAAGGSGSAPQSWMSSKDSRKTCLTVRCPSLLARHAVPIPCIVDNVLDSGNSQ
jgi:hypothetical protein